MMQNEEKTSILVRKSIIDDIVEYCELNEFDFTKMVEKFLRNGIANEKWGDAPFLNKKQEVKKEEVKPKIEYIITEKQNEEPEKKEVAEKKPRKTKKEAVIEPQEIKVPEAAEIIKPKKRKLK